MTLESHEPAGEIAPGHEVLLLHLSGPTQAATTSRRKMQQAGGLLVAYGFLLVAYALLLAAYAFLLVAYGTRRFPGSCTRFPATRGG